MRKVAEGCGRLRKVAEGCGRLRKVAEGCRRLPKVAEGCRRLPKVAEGCRRLPKVAEGCRRLRKVAEGCGRLPKVAEGCGRLPKVAEGCQSARYGLIGIAAWVGVSPRSILEASFASSQVDQSLGKVVPSMFSGNKGALGGEFSSRRSQLIHGRAFVDFIEHGAKNHRATGTDGVVGLSPIKGPAFSRNLIQRTGIQIFPGEARKNDGMYSRPAAFTAVRSGRIEVHAKIICPGNVGIAAHRPRAQDIKEAKHRTPGSVGFASFFKVPIGRQAAHDRCSRPARKKLIAACPCCGVSGRPEKPKPQSPQPACPCAADKTGSG